jgi:hypothetical protein
MEDSKRSEDLFRDPAFTLVNGFFKVSEIHIHNLEDGTPIDKVSNRNSFRAGRVIAKFGAGLT